jgi:plastocyanin
MRLITIFVAALAFALPAAAATHGVTLTIRHQVHGCHTWSFDGASWRAAQTVQVRRGTAITVVDNDIMPHTLVQIHGPGAAITHPAMRHMGASARITFPAAGRYVFTTKAGEDYMKGMKTTGEDNVLRLVVTVR